MTTNYKVQRLISFYTVKYESILTYYIYSIDPCENFHIPDDMRHRIIDFARNINNIIIDGIVRVNINNPKKTIKNRRNIMEIMTSISINFSNEFCKFIIYLAKNKLTISEKVIMKSYNNPKGLMVNINTIIIHKILTDYKDNYTMIYKKKKLSYNEKLLQAILYSVFDSLKPDDIPDSKTILQDKYNKLSMARK